MTDSLFTRFSKKCCPKWLCPGCYSVSLAIVPESFMSEMDASTRRKRNGPDFEPEDSTCVFSCMLKCRKTGCGEVVAVGGFGGVDTVWGTDDNGRSFPEYATRFQAKYFNPPLPFFVPPEGCPDNVKRHLRNISSLLTGHPAAAANAIRTLLEVLLDELKVPRMALRRDTKHRFLRLHDRITCFPGLLGPHLEAFLALKYFGNAGSHGGGVITKSNLEDACQVLEQIVKLLYFRHPDVSEHIARLAKSFK